MANNIVGLVKPHHYSPDYMAMGDCRICGRVAGDPVHKKIYGCPVVIDKSLPDDVIELRGATSARATIE